jgi:hypothetical protein
MFMPHGHWTLRVKHFFLLLLFVNTLGCMGLEDYVPEVSPDPPSDASDPGFCALKSMELLKTLDGTWKLYQDPGAALAGFVPVPLPRHDPVTLILKYDFILHLMEVTSDGLNEGTIMFPVVQEQQEVAEKILAENIITGEKAPKKANKSGSGCEGHTIPILVGTRNYVRDTGDSPESSPRIWRIQKWLCNKFGLPCAPIPWKDRTRHLNMEMTLLLEFSSSRYGTGSLLFIGHHKDTITIEGGEKSSFFHTGREYDVNIPYVAQAPIVIAR